jgi:hypothetical protein
MTTSEENKVLTGAQFFLLEFISVGSMAALCLLAGRPFITFGPLILFILSGAGLAIALDSLERRTRRYQRFVIGGAVAASLLFLLGLTLDNLKAGSLDAGNVVTGLFFALTQAYAFLWLVENDEG